jgi:hypothetical protein
VLLHWIIAATGKKVKKSNVVPPLTLQYVSLPDSEGGVSHMNRRLLVLGMVLGMIAVLLGACTVGKPGETPVTPATGQSTPSGQQPIEVISVLDTYNAGQTVNPGGPTIEITLKNISSEPVVSLQVTLQESGPRTFNFDFNVTSSNPLLPNQSISAKRILIGGGFGDGIGYYLVIHGALQSGLSFAYMK